MKQALNSLPQELLLRQAQVQTRRHFLRQCQVGLGGIALAGLLPPVTGWAGNRQPSGLATKAKRDLPAHGRVASPA